MKVVMFQHMMKTPIDKPTIAVLKAFTLPKYSGARNSALAPKLFISEPFTTLNKTTQKIKSIWYFLK
jgi:hypothetical protein